MSRLRIDSRVLLVLLVLFAASVGSPEVAADDAPSPPAQPTTGAGSADYAFDAVVASRYGEEPDGFWLFEPANIEAGTQTPSREPVPVIVFLHGFSALDPVTYRGWIDHLVRRGAVVIYPDWQKLSIFELKPDEYLGNAVFAIREAFRILEEPGHAAIDPERFAVTGHSVGGVLAVGIAAEAEAWRLPAVKAVLSVEPGGCAGCGGGVEQFQTPFADLSLIPDSTKLIVVTGADDSAVGDAGARLIWDATAQIPNEHRDYVVVPSDDHGQPELRADHFMPQTGSIGGETDALDWYGLWKVFDLQLGCAFGQVACDDAMNGSAGQRSMGAWSDGVPVAELIVTDGP